MVEITKDELIDGLKREAIAGLSGGCVQLTTLNIGLTLAVSIFKMSAKRVFLPIYVGSIVAGAITSMAVSRYLVEITEPKVINIDQTDTPIFKF